MDIVQRLQHQAGLDTQLGRLAAEIIGELQLKDTEIERLRAELAKFHCQQCGGFQIPEGTELYCGCPQQSDLYLPILPAVEE